MAHQYAGFVGLGAGSLSTPPPNFVAPPHNQVVNYTIQPTNVAAFSAYAPHDAIVSQHSQALTYVLNNTFTAPPPSAATQLFTSPPPLLHKQGYAGGAAPPTAISFTKPILGQSSATALIQQYNQPVLTTLTGGPSPLVTPVHQPPPSTPATSLTPLLTAQTFSNNKQLTSTGGSSLGRAPRTNSNFNYNNSTNANRRYQQSADRSVFCDACKFKCANEAAYKEHLESDRHKRRSNDSQGQSNFQRNKSSYRCEACDMTFSGNYAYQTHVRGVKHQRLLKTQLTPNAEPKLITNPSVLKVLTPSSEDKGSKSSTEPKRDLPAETKDIEPVGASYVEVLTAGRTITYHCKLCDCSFNDPNARDAHLRGRRHRFQYKRHIDPTIEVDMKMPMISSRRGNYRHAVMPPTPLMTSSAPIFRPQTPIAVFTPVKMPQSVNDKYMTTAHDALLPTAEELAAVEQVVSNLEAALKMVSDNMAERDLLNAPPIEGQEPVKSAQTPAENSQNMEGVETMVTDLDVENKSVVEGKDKIETSEQDVVEDEGEQEANEEEPPKDPKEERRLLKGVMRVGDLAKRLLTKGNLNIELVVLCSLKPTKTLLREVAEALPDQLGNITEEQFTIEVRESEASIFLENSDAPKVYVVMTLTSVSMRELVPESEDLGESTGIETSDDILDKDKCLEALANLRRAKWFQACCMPNPVNLMVLRILKDFCKRNSAWFFLPQWPLELLVERLFSAACFPLSCEQIFRHVFEAISSGLFLSDGNGLVDPCEKEKMNAVKGLAIQQLENLTLSAQLNLRLMAFDQLYKVLDVDKLPGQQSSVFSGNKRGLLPEELTDSKKVKTDSPMDEE